MRDADGNGITISAYLPLVVVGLPAVAPAAGNPHRVV